MQRANWRLRSRQHARHDQAEARAVCMAELIKELAIAGILMLLEQRFEHAEHLRNMQRRRPARMPHAVEQAYGLRQQQRAHQKAGQRAAQGPGYELTVHPTGSLDPAASSGGWRPSSKLKEPPQNLGQFTHERLRERTRQIQKHRADFRRQPLNGKPGSGPAETQASVRDLTVRSDRYRNRVEFRMKHAFVDHDFALGYSASEASIVRSTLRYSAGKRRCSSSSSAA